MCFFYETVLVQMGAGGGFGYFKIFFSATKAQRHKKHERKTPSRTFCALRLCGEKICNLAHEPVITNIKSLINR
jgi:hypothetical protein